MKTIGYLLAALLILPACFAIPKFIFPNSNNPCILADFGMEFTLSYTEEGTPTKTLKYPLPSEGITVSGSCSSAKTHMLTLKAIDELSLIFTINNKTGLTDIQLTYTFNVSTHFKDTKYTGSLAVTSPIVSIYTNPAVDESYLCFASGPLELTANDPKHKAVLDISFESVQLQAFSVKSTEFGPEKECPWDVTTGGPGPVTTQLPTTEPIPPPIANYTVREGNDTCLYLQGQLWLSVQYLNSSKKNDTQEIAVEKAMVSGVCGANVDILRLEFADTFVLEFILEKTTDGDTFSYALKNMTLEYNITLNLFPNADQSMLDDVFFAATYSKKLWETPKSAYFVCNSAQDVPLNGIYEVTLHTEDLKVSAFHKGLEPPSVTGEDYIQCDADMETSSIVPIAVGAALAGLVVIVLIAYLVGRRRSQKGYESV